MPRMRLLLMLALLLPAFTRASLATVTGTLVTSTGVGVDLRANSIYFLPDPSSIPAGPPWNAGVGIGTTLVFNGGPLNLNEGVEINNNSPFVFGGTALPVDFYLRFAAHGLLDFELTGVGAGAPSSDCAAAVSTGQTCSLNVNGTTSPLILTKSGTGTNISLSLFGLDSDTGPIGAGPGTWVGVFSMTVPNITPDQIALFFCSDYNAANMCTAADVALGTTFRVNNAGGTFIATPAVPEPATLLLMASGMAALGSQLRRKRL